VSLAGRIEGPHDDSWQSVAWFHMNVSQTGPNMIRRRVRITFDFERNIREI